MAKDGFARRARMRKSVPARSCRESAAKLRYLSAMERHSNQRTDQKQPLLRRRGSRLERYLLAIHRRRDAGNAFPGRRHLLGEPGDPEVPELESEQHVLEVRAEELQRTVLLLAGRAVPVDDEVLMPVDPGFGIGRWERHDQIRNLQARGLPPDAAVLTDSVLGQFLLDRESLDPVDLA